MNSTEDRRVIRTKGLIRDALVALIEEKGFEAISVKDITTKANINRGTFYLHYKDKFDLLDQTLGEVVQDIGNIILDMKKLSEEDFRGVYMPFTIIVRVFEYINNNASLMQALLVTKGNYKLQAEIKKLMMHSLFELNLMPFIKKEKFLVPIEYFASYIASAHIGVMLEWLDRGRQESPEQMAQVLIKLSFRGPLFAAGFFGEGQPNVSLS